METTFEFQQSDIVVCCKMSNSIQQLVILVRSADLPQQLKNHCIMQLVTQKGKSGQFSSQFQKSDSEL